MSAAYAILVDVPAGLILRQVQKNEVLGVVLKAGLDPSQFEWKGVTYSDGSFENYADRLVHRTSGYFFEFTLRNGTKHFCQMSPGPHSLEAEQFPGSWDGQLNYVEQWASDLSAELAAPDLWDSVNASGALDELPLTFEQNTQFSPSEIAQLSDRLDVIGARLAEVVDSDDLRLLAERLVEHLREETKKQGRWDWLFLAMGSLMTFMANAAFDPHRAKELINVLLAGIRSLGS